MAHKIVLAKYLDRIGQAAGCADDECADLAWVNDVVIDWSRMLEADIGYGVYIGT